MCIAYVLVITSTSIPTRPPLFGMKNTREVETFFYSRTYITRTCSYVYLRIGIYIYVGIVYSYLYENCYSLSIPDKLVFYVRHK